MLNFLFVHILKAFQPKDKLHYKVFWKTSLAFLETGSDILFILSLEKKSHQEHVFFCSLFIYCLLCIFLGYF